MTETIKNIDDFRRRYLSYDRKRYPVTLDIQVTQEEATLILNWIRARRAHDYVHYSYVHRNETGTH
ncbi:MAG: hypothetical protein ACTSPB_13670 [Candidatus Thorarchaeota archaeon]